MSGLPKGWTTVALREIVELKYGKSLPKKLRTPGGVPVYGSAGAVDHHEEAFTSGPALVVGRKGSIGQIHAPEHPFWPIDTTYFTKHDDSRVDLRWLYHRLRSVGLESMNKSAAVPGLNREDVYRITTLLPPLAEQRRIAAILDRTDDLIRKQGREISTAQQLRSSTTNAFISSTPAETALLGDHLDFLTSGSRGWAKYYAEEGPAFLRIQNIREGTVDAGDLARVIPPETAEARRTRVEARDVVLSITADLGRTAVIPESLGPAYINQHLAILRSSTLVSEYLSAFLESSQGVRQLQKKNRGQTKAGLNFADIRSVTVPKPTLRAQRQFASEIHGIAAQLQRQKQRQEVMNDLRNSLQSRAFRGEL